MAERETARLEEETRREQAVNQNDIRRFGALLSIVLRVHQNDSPVRRHPMQPEKPQEPER
jgi:hypothetical protein